MDTNTLIKTQIFVLFLALFCRGAFQKNSAKRDSMNKHPTTIRTRPLQPQRSSRPTTSRTVKTVPKYEIQPSTKIIISSPRSIIATHSTLHNKLQLASTFQRKMKEQIPLPQKVQPVTEVDLNTTKQNLLLVKPIQPMNQILKNLYLGNINAAKSIDYLKRHNITHVLSVVDFAFVNKQYSLCKPPITHMVIKAPDQESFNLLSSFDKAIEFIRKAIHDQGGTVLVHCAMGISRSTTIVISYLMQIQKMSFEHAMQFVRKKRPIINPNPGFKLQLRKFEQFLQLQQHQSNNLILPPLQNSNKNIHLSSLQINQIKQSNL